MTQSAHAQRYRRTESKYKGGAEELYVTYEVEQPTRGGNKTLYPKVKRVYIAGHVTDWQVGEFTKKSGRTVYGVKVDYEQHRQGPQREAYNATRAGRRTAVRSASVDPSISAFSQIVEVPPDAQNIQFQGKKLPAKYRTALQNVR